MIIVSWARAYPRFHMAIWAAIAVSWLILGSQSSRVPWGNDMTWLLANAVVSGAALGVAYRRTHESMWIYLICALTVGSLRSAAYLANGSAGPGWVWAILALTNIVLLGRWGADTGRIAGD